MTVGWYWLSYDDSKLVLVVIQEMTVGWYRLPCDDSRLVLDVIR